MKQKSLRVMAALLCVVSLLACNRFSKNKNNLHAMVKVSAAVQPQTDLTIASKYPLTNAEVSLMALRADETEIRHHGWTILEKMTTDNDAPRTDGNSNYEALWDSDTTPWDTKCTLGLFGTNGNCPTRNPTSNTDCRLAPPTDKANTQPNLETPIQQVDPNGHLGSQNTSKSVALISSVRYNAAAARAIHDHCLYDRELKIGDQKEGLNNFTGDANQFDPSAVIVKLIWAIPDPATSHITVWDPAYGEAMTAPKIAEWPTIKVNVDTSVPCSANGFTSRRGQAPDTSVVPVNCFYHRQYGCNLLRNDIQPSHFGGLFHCSTGQTTFQALLMGVHIITAEQHDWVWNTYWWTPDPSKDTLMAGQTDTIAKRGPWRFYAMQTTMSPSTPAAKDGYARTAFNPYIEGVDTQNAAVSNCMYCHKRAVVYPKDTTLSVTADLAKGSPDRCAFMTPVPAGCSSPAADYNAPYTSDQTPTHFLWSLADNVDYLRQSRQQLIPPGVLHPSLKRKKRPSSTVGKPGPNSGETS